MVVPAAHAAKISVGKCFKLGKLKLGDILPGERERGREREKERERERQGGALLCQIFSNLKIGSSSIRYFKKCHYFLAYF